jgi:hypothetical protein
MNPDSDQYNLVAIRNLLRDAFTADTLWRFCQDRADFRQVLFEIGRNAGLAEMIDVLLEHCRTQLLFDDIFSAVREVNPRQYARYEAELCTFEAATPRTTPQIPHNLRARSEFVGREAEKARAHEGLCSRYSLISIEGIGGIGKTSLALEVAYECLQASQGGESPEGIVAFDSFVWTTAKDRDLTLNDLLDAISLTLNYPGIMQCPLEAKRFSVEKLLRDRSCLLIVDNFETIKDPDVWDFLQGLPEPCKALVTTREQRLSHVWSISLKGLQEPESLALIRGEGRRLDLDSIVSAKDISLLHLHQATGGAPLAIKWAVGQIKQRGQSLDSVLRALHAGQAKPFEQIFTRSWDLLSLDARRVLMVMTLFATSASRAAIEAASDIHHFTLDEALGQLVEMSLVDPTDELESRLRRYSIHPLTRSFANRHLVQEGEFERQAMLRLASNYVETCREAGEWGEPEAFPWFEVEVVPLLGVASPILPQSSRSSRRNEKKPLRSQRWKRVRQCNNTRQGHFPNFEFLQM